MFAQPDHLTGAVGRNYLMHASLPVVGFLAAVLAVTASVDPYLLRASHADAWRPAPVSQRLVKPLQVIARQPEVVFVGTSRTLMGFDPARLAPQRAYNFGISGASAAEIEVFTRHALRWTDAKTFVIGVDLFTLDAGKPAFEGGSNADVGSLRHLVEASAASLLSFEAIKDSVRGAGLIGDGRRPLCRGDGLMETTTAAAAIASDSAKWELAYQAGKPAIHVSSERLACIARALAACRRQNVRVILYIPPVHRWMFDLERSRDGVAAYDWFRPALHALALRYGADFYDFLPPNAVAEIPITNNNGFYSDAGHFTPRVGDLMLHRMGFPVAPRPDDLPLLAGFGMHANEVRSVAEDVSEPVRR